MTGKHRERPGEAYVEFAFAYEQALGRRFFASLRPLIDSVLNRYPTIAKTHLDLACGTGLAMQHLQKRGFRSYGIDASVPMLALARKRGRRLAAGDLRKLPLASEFGLVTCLYDSLNHMLEREDLVAAFSNCRPLLHADSIFLFDMNHPAVYPRIWGMDEPFVSAARDHRLMIETRFSTETATGTAEISGWARISAAQVPIAEIHRQRAWTLEEIRSALKSAGLSVIEEIDFDPFLELGGGPGVKVVFIASKAKSTSLEVL